MILEGWEGATWLCEATGKKKTLQTRKPAKANKLREVERNLHRKEDGGFHIEEEVASRSESKTCGTEKANRLCEVFDKREKTMYIPAGHQAAHLSHVAF